MCSFLQLKFERIQDKKSFTFQLVYDPKSNLTYVVRLTQVSAFMTHVDAVLKKASSEFQAGQIAGHYSCSLYPAVLSLAKSTLPL